MKSPFPGMDPYLEAKWPEVHASLIVYSRNQINQQLPEDLQANIEENLAVRVEDEPNRPIRPDLHIAEDIQITGDRASLASAGVAVQVAVAEPLLVPRPEYLERHVEIVDQTGRVITAIEFLSPWNKVGQRGRQQYTRKQTEYIDAGVNLVEVDLVRQGEYILAAPLDELPRHKMPSFEPTPYLICVYRDSEPDRFEVYRAPLEESLPNIPIPLRRGERDVVLQLQPLIDDCYRDGRYHRINYQDDPQPPFDAHDARWLDNRLREQGRRK